MSVPGFISWVMFNMVLATWQEPVVICWVAVWTSVFWPVCVQFRLSHLPFRPFGIRFYLFYFSGSLAGGGEVCPLLLPLLSVPGITSGKMWHFLLLSQAFQANVEKFLSGRWCSLGDLFLPTLLGEPLLGRTGRAEDMGTSALTLVRVVFLYPMVTVSDGRTLTWLVSFPGKMIHVDTVKVNFPKTFFGEFSTLLWFCASHLPTLDIQARLQDPLYKWNKIFCCPVGLQWWTATVPLIPEKGFVGQSTGLVCGTLFQFMWSGAV